MKLLRGLPLRRSRVFGLLSDIAMVAAAASRVARRPAAGSASRSSTPGQWILVAGAAFRLLRRIRRVRRDRRLAAAIDDVDPE